MSAVTPRPDPETPTRLSWQCPGCGETHQMVETRVDAMESAWNLLGHGAGWVLLVAATAATMRDQDLAERAANPLSLILNFIRRG